MTLITAEPFFLVAAYAIRRDSHMGGVMCLNRLLPAKLDFTFLAPAVLCNIAFIIGTLPPLFCLDATFFAYLSLGIFVLSILIHIYILFRWQRYQDSSPLGYAIVQPVLHMIMLVYALAVGAADFCAAKPSPSELTPIHHNYLPPPPDISEAIFEEKHP